MGCTATKPMTSGGGATPLDVKLTEKVEGLAQSLDQKLDGAGKTVENGVATATGSVKEAADSASNAVKEGAAQAAAAKESGQTLANKVDGAMAKISSDVKEVMAGVEKLIHDNNVAKGLCLGDTFPNFEFEASMIGNAKLWDYFGNGWGVLFSHPADFTPVCTTELSTVAKYKPEFDKRNCKVIALSCDSVDSHNSWIQDIGSYEPSVGIAEKGLGYPIIADPKREIAFRLGMMDAVSKDAAGLPLTARAVFFVGPDRKLKLSILYPASTGRNFDELIRVLDSLQLTAERKLATPANWVTGNDCVVAPSVSTEDAKKMFPKGVKVMELPSKKEYLRFTADPRDGANGTPAAPPPAAVAPQSSAARDLKGEITKLVQSVSEPHVLLLGDVMPNFAIEATDVGKTFLWDYFGDSWSILFSHPADFTPVCTTELSTVAKYKPEFDKRNCKLIALSCDSVDSHSTWIKDIGSYEPSVGIAEKGLGYPIIADPKREMAFRLGMMDAVAKDAAGIPLTARAVFICGPDKKLKLSMLYPATTGRNFDEIVRVLDSLQLTAERKLATPANWVGGNECVVAPSVSTEDAKKMFPKGVKIMELPSKKEYLRFTPDPREVAA